MVCTATFRGVNGTLMAIGIGAVATIIAGTVGYLVAKRKE